MPLDDLISHVEIIDNVCLRLATCDIASLAQTNSALNAVGKRRLYHTIGVDLHPTRLLRCLILLDRNEDLALLVRTLEVNLVNNSPTKSYYFMLERVLRKMINLTSLVIELPKRHSPTWVLPIAPMAPSESSSPQSFKVFRLRSLTISMHCKYPLARFLDSQSEITSLTLRGINSESSNPLFPFIPTFFHSVGASLDPDHALVRPALTSHPNHFTLLSTSLPKLSHFTAIHAGPAIIRAIIKSRPVTHMSIPLFPSHTKETLSILSLASKPLARLSIMSFDLAAPHFLLAELATRFPVVEALHIVLLMAEVTVSTLLDWGNHLAGFKRLKYITLMVPLVGDGRGDKGTGGGGGDCGQEEFDERKIVKLWHSSCPTLRTIILPQGKVWLEGTSTNDENADKDWKSLNWDDEWE